MDKIVSEHASSWIQQLDGTREIIKLVKLSGKDDILIVREK